VVLVALLLASIVHDSAEAPPVTQTRERAIPRLEWGMADSKTYAVNRLQVWVEKEWLCLEKLWTRESHWNPRAYNKIKVSGKNAGGIPQLLGLDPTTHPAYQIEKGLTYIYHRYDTPCEAWKYWQKHRWY
jgi:hypothetical protein